MESSLKSTSTYYIKDAAKHEDRKRRGNVSPELTKVANVDRSISDMLVLSTCKLITWLIKERVTYGEVLIFLQ